MHACVQSEVTIATVHCHKKIYFIKEIGQSLLYKRNRSKFYYRRNRSKFAL